jgi:FeS assembly protein IscX
MQRWRASGSLARSSSTGGILMKWEDYEDIAIELHELHPDLDPLTVRFTDLHNWVCDLPEFDDDPQASTEGKLERIQMAWLEEWQDAQEDG